jgi:hypothetical protein
MPQISCADLTSTCEATVEGGTGRDALLGYIAHGNREHRDELIPLDAVIDAISDTRLPLSAARS